MTRALGQPLTIDAFNAALQMLDVEDAKLWAVLEVEAKRCGFLSNRRPVILFERHKFHERTGGKYSATHPHISNEDPGGYGAPGLAQYHRLDQASALDLDAAICSTSWGLGQVMGFNAETAGFRNAKDMVALMSSSEDEQLRGMVQFIRACELQQPLRNSDWAAFARRYNGKHYERNSYDTRLKGAFHKYREGVRPNLEHRAAQLFLLYLGFDPGIVDGWFGPASLQALNHFRLKNGKREVDSLSDAALVALRNAVASHPMN